MEIGNLKSLIDSSSKIYVGSHMNPDGDNLGCITAMYLALKKYGKDVYLIEDDEVPVAEQFLPGISDMVHSKDLEKNPDMYITLDCANVERLGDAKELFLSAKYKINIDHHSTNTRFGDLNLIDEYSPATGETLYQILREIGLKIDKDIATCIYTAISSDTGSFKYDSVRKSTFNIAADLLDYGVNINDIAVNLYQNRSLEKTKLLIKALESLELYEDDKIGLVVVRDEDVEAIGAKKSDTDGIVEFVRDIANIELAILLKVKTDMIRLSTRSKSYIDCTKIATEFGGGGHIRAAGATIFDDLDTAKEEVLKYAIREFCKC